MSIKVRSFLHSLVIIAVLIFSAIGPTIAYADGGTSTGTPPAPTTANNESQPTGKTKKLAPATEKSKTPKEPVSSANTSNLNNVPADTTVAVINAHGQYQALATQAAADALATTSDPIWCPQGQAPTPGANGCTSSFSSFTALLTFLSGNATYQGAGTIYVQQGAYTGGEASVNFNSFNL